MLYPDRATVCVSSQAGCAMGCGFCATGQAGFTRHLTTGEIVEQVVRAARRAARRRPAGQQRRVHGHGRAAGQRGRRVGRRRSGSTATSGCRPATSRSRRSASCPASAGSPSGGCPVTLAVSLHAANDELRDELVPINRRYHLDDADGGVRRLPRRQPPAAELRVGADRRRQRPPVGRRRAGRAVPAAAAGGPRQPDPAQPDAGLADEGHAARPGRRVPRPAASRSASTPRCAATAAPTSTPPAVSSPRRAPVAVSSRRPAPTGTG